MEKVRVPIGPRPIPWEEVDFYMSGACSDFNPLALGRKESLAFSLAMSTKQGKILFSDDAKYILCQLYHELRTKKRRCEMHHCDFTCPACELEKGIH